MVPMQPPNAPGAAPPQGQQGMPPTGAAGPQPTGTSTQLMGMPSNAPLGFPSHPQHSIPNQPNGVMPGTPTRPVHPRQLGGPRHGRSSITTRHGLATADEHPWHGARHFRPACLSPRQQYSLANNTARYGQRVWEIWTAGSTRSNASATNRATRAAAAARAAWWCAVSCPSNGTLGGSLPNSHASAWHASSRPEPKRAR